MNPQGAIQRLFKRHKTWIERNPSFAQNAIEEVRTSANDPTLYSLLQLAESMRGLGIFCAKSGILQVHAGERNWVQISGALRAYHWAVRCRFKFYFKLFAPERPHRRSSFLHHLPLAFCLFCHSIACGEEKEGQELWSLLQMPVRDADQRVAEWWQFRHFEPFFALVYCKVTGQASPFEAAECDLGIYRAILDHWEDPGALSTDLKSACDYHLKHVENTRDWDAEFDLPPFDLIPGEIKAIQMLRERSGLAPVYIEHPLMDCIPPFEPALIPADLSDVFDVVSDKYNEFA